MEKKSIGGFIAALRKANGMTQQEVADRLHISNKAVSRWERDESAPDLSLIPAIAELFGVTCDELLKGERIFAPPQPEKSEPKVEKQLKALINRTISSFKTLIWIALALAAVGFICMLGISYGFYRPVIGFAVMLLFETAAVVCTAIAVTRMKSAKTDNELLENADFSLLRQFERTLGSFSYLAFFAAFSAIILSLPFLFYLSPYPYVDSVLAFDCYILLFCIISLALALLSFTVKDLYITWITDRPYCKSSNARRRWMNILQLGATALAAVLFLIAPYCETHPHQTSPLKIGLDIAAFILLCVNVGCFILLICKCKTERKELLLPGIRNMLMIPAVLDLAVYTVSYDSYEMLTENTSYATATAVYRPEADILLAVGWALLNVVIFKVIELVWKKKRS